MGRKPVIVRKQEFELFCRGILRRGWNDIDRRNDHRRGRLRSIDGVTSKHILPHDRVGSRTQVQRTHRSRQRLENESFAISILSQVGKGLGGTVGQVCDGDFAFGL